MPTEPVSDTQSMMLAKAPAATLRVVEAARQADLPCEFRQLVEPPGTLAEIAAFCDCPPDSVVKVVLYKGKASRKPVLILISGEHRIDERILAGLVGEVLEKADADFVRRITGYPMGSVPPIGIINRITVLMDNRLTQFQQIWCPAGTPETFFMAPTRPLARLAAARIVQIS